MKERYKNLSIFLKTALDIIFCLGAALTVAMPFILNAYPNIVYRYFWFNLGNQSARFAFTIALIEVFGVSALIIVRQLVLIFSSVNNDNPFIKANVRRFRIIAVCCFIVFFTFLIKCVCFFTLVTLVLTAAFLIAGLAALVFSHLFYQAVEFKS